MRTTKGFVVYEIEKNIPMRVELYPFEHMEVGDSFVIPKAFAGSMRKDAAKYAKAHHGWHYATKLVVENDNVVVRIWRVAEPRKARKKSDAMESFSSDTE